MRVQGIAILGLAIATATARAQAGTDRAAIASCAAIAADTVRLKCFDTLAKRLTRPSQSAPPRATPTGTGTWKISTESSPIDDSKNVYLTQMALQSIPSMIGRVRPTLMIRCKEGVTEAYVTWGVYLGLNTTFVLTRLDQETATTDIWGISTDNTATFYRDGAVQWVRQLLAHSKLIVQVTPYGQNSVMVTFNLVGLSQAIRPLQAACPWE